MNDSAPGAVEAERTELLARANCCEASEDDFRFYRFDVANAAQALVVCFIFGAGAVVYKMGDEANQPMRCLAAPFIRRT